MAPAISTKGVEPSARREGVRRDFPALRQEVQGHSLVYLDSAATALKPQCVVDAINRAYTLDTANVHRGVHTLSARATEAFEASREKLRAFLGAGSTQEVVFVRGATEAINLVAQSYGRPRLGPGDEILVTGLEHHSNIVPWQLLCEQTGARLVVVPIDGRGDVSIESFEELLTARTRIVAVAHVSNALGTLLPVETLTKLSHDRGAVVVIDGAQAVPHLPVNVRALGCDFYAFSGHKMYGPTGIGVLYGKRDLLESMVPYQGGGDMIKSVTFERTIYNELPYKFEAGTPHIAGAIGLGAAVDYLTGLGMQAVCTREAATLAYATEALASLPGVRLIGTAPRKVAVLSFLIDGVHPHDVGTVADAEGVAIRTGHHCAQPVMERFGVAATARASLGVYNTEEDIDALVRALHRVRAMFG